MTSMLKQQISHQRDNELKYTYVESILWSLMAFVASTSTVLAMGFLVLATESDKQLDSANIFTALALLGQLSAVLSSLPLKAPALIKGAVSWNRIVTFLTSESDLTAPSLTYDNENSVQLQGVNFFQCKLLQPFDFDFAAGTFTCVTGSPNKTSFVKGILGEDKLRSGHLVWKANAACAYMGQDPWLLDATIKDNIVFYRSYKHKRYLKVSSL